MLGDHDQRYQDIILLGSVGILLAAIHFFVPSSLQTALAFDHQRFTGYTLFTAAYVHTSTFHLLSNLLGYGVGAGIAYTLCHNQGRRRWFSITTIVFVLVLPILVNVSSYGAFQSLGIEPTSRGFSGVVAGYAGFVLVAMSRGLVDRHGRAIGWNIGTGVFLLLAGEIAVIYTGVPSPVLIAVLALGFVITFGQVGWKGMQCEWTEVERGPLLIEGIFITTVVTLLALFVWALFPAAIVNDGTTTNIIAHGAGFIWGIGLAIGVGIVLDENIAL